MEEVPKNESLNQTKEVFSFESATADIIIDSENKTVWINDMYAGEKGQNQGTKLLNELKKKFSDCVINGIAHPTEFDQPEVPSREDTERAYELGWDFKKKIINPIDRELTAEEKKFVKDISEQDIAHQRSEPFSRLHRFYKKNGFKVDISGNFESIPPHTLIDTEQL